jgi:ATP-binding cassette subfamily B protein
MTPGQLRAPLVAFLLLGLGEVVFGSLARGMQLRIGPRQRQEVIREVYAYLQHHSHRFLTNNFAGALVHRLSEMSQGVNMTLWTLVFDFWPVFITFGVSVVLLVAAHAQLGLIVGAWAVGFIICSFFLAMRSRPYALKAAAARSETTGRVVDSVTNLSSVKLFARLAFERAFLDRYLHKEFQAITTSFRYTERIRRFQFLAAVVLKVAVLWYAIKLWSHGEIGVAEFVMATSMSLLLITESRNLSRRFLEFFEYVGNVSNGVHAVVQAHELVDGPQARSIAVMAGGIRFENVDFAYDGSRRIFENLSIEIPAGQRVGLVGASGSGKSTFVSLILRQHDPQVGRITIDGADLRDFTQQSLHEQLSLIPQDPNLFHRSLRDNIRYGKLDASDLEVEQAARRAHAHEFIAQIPEGYESMVGERGVKLSGGQRQRIAIARVILKDAPILILDEATSSLDSITEKAIQASLNVAMAGKTVIVVAHRLSTIAHLDRILVFENGRIVEDGRPADLMEKKGAYFRLWQGQADGFLLAGSGSPTAEPVESEATGQPARAVEDEAPELEDTDAPLVPPAPVLVRG